MSTTHHTVSIRPGHLVTMAAWGLLGASVIALLRSVGVLPAAWAGLAGAVDIAGTVGAIVALSLAMYLNGLPDRIQRAVEHALIMHDMKRDLGRWD